MAEERFGVVGSTVDGVFFTEADIPGATSIQFVEATVNRQNASLPEVKAALATQVRAYGGDILMRFEYGQRKHGFFKNLVTWDGEHWYGKGYAARSQ